jgi:hypothetical protein
MVKVAKVLPCGIAKRVFHRVKTEVTDFAAPTTLFQSFVGQCALLRSFVGRRMIKEKV